MFEVAFRVNPNGKLYEQYFVSHAEKQKFAALSQKFCLKHFGEPRECVVTKQLELTLSDFEREKYQDQLFATTIGKRSKFLIQSELQQKWVAEVISHVDFKRIHAIDNWPTLLGFPFSAGKKTLWHTAEGKLYGQIQLRYGNWHDIERSGDAVVIPIGEYKQVKAAERRE